MPNKPVAAGATTGLPAHGASVLPSVVVDDYNVELRDDGGFLGDRVTKGAFRELIENQRKALRRRGGDPLGKRPSKELAKQEIDEVLAEGEPESAGLIHGAIEDFAGELVEVIRRFLKLKSWMGTERIVVGGGLRGSRAGELVIGRAAVILRTEQAGLELSALHHDPDEGGLIGTLHLAPSWIFEGYDATLGVDIGGTNIRAGVIKHRLRRAPDLSKASVEMFELWRHADEKPSRDEATERLTKMLRGLIARAEKAKTRVAPFIGIGCPGIIAPDGTIERGAQNLPGNWEASKFNLPQCVREGIPTIGDHDTVVLLHNDAVVQGLSEVPFMHDVERWAVLTIGTGLGNARFTNREAEG